MDVYEAIEDLQNLYKASLEKAKSALDLSKGSGQLHTHLLEEHDRTEQLLRFFNPDSSPLIHKGERYKVVEEELTKVASKKSKSELIRTSVAQELEIWNLKQILTFLTKQKTLDNKSRLDKKLKDYDHSQSRNRNKDEKFAGNTEILLGVLQKTLSGLGRDPLPWDYRDFKIRAERVKPAFIPKPKELEEDKLLSTEDRACEQERKTRTSWNDGTLRKFWTKETGLPASTKKPSSLK